MSKLLPSVLMLIAFALLLWVSSLRPADEGTGSPSSTVAASSGEEKSASNANSRGHAQHDVDPHGDLDESGVAQPVIPREIVSAPTAPNARPGTVAVEVTGPDLRGTPAEVLVRNADGSVVARLKTDKFGHAILEHLNHGRYRVEAVDPDCIYTVSRGMDIDLDRDGASAQIVMSRGDATLTGTVVDGSERPVANATVTFRSGEFSGALLSGAKGTFRMAGLPSGTYQVSVEGASNAPENVVLHSGETTDHWMQVVRSASLRVQLTGHPRTLAKASTVVVTPADETVGPAKTLTVPAGEDSEPAIEFSNLVATTYHVDVQEADGSSMFGTEGGPAYTLSEGGEHSWAISLMGTDPHSSGASLTSSILTWTVVIGSIASFLLLGAMITLPGQLFLSPKRPAGLPPRAASPEA